ncbi:MAG: YfcE family phosphodiesterase [Clostridia bacterium]|nr:YfcE family phosphodiesterase [Clostridia bacterium]
MKILVLSDSHGKYQYIFDIIYENADSDVIIHLGDGVSDVDEAAREVADMRHLKTLQIIKVRGNCDIFTSEPVTSFDNIGGHKFYCTHGYTVNGSASSVKARLGVDALCEDARKQGRDVVLFGHTHKAIYEDRDGVHLFNPGAVLKGQFGIITIDDKTGDISFEHKVLEY